MATKRKSKLVACNIAQISPLDCGSSVGYKIVNGSRSVWGEIDLTDCDRKVKWNFYASQAGSLEKIDKVLELLTEFRDAWALASTKPRTARKRRVKRATT